MSFRVPVYIKKVMPGDAAAKAALEAGDHIVAIDTVATPSFTELVPTLAQYGGKATTVSAVRGIDTLRLGVTPSTDGKLGFELCTPFEVFRCDTTQYGLLRAIPIGITNGTDMLVTYVSSLKHLFSKRGAESIGGFGAIGSLFPPYWNWRTFWELTAFLSIMLAFMNIIPIPALDGGHVAFLLWEVVTRRAPSEEFLERAQMVGMTLLLALLLYANFNDIYRFIIR